MAYPVPHTAQIPFTLADGKEIVINGTVSPGCNRFSINLCVGGDYNSDTALHFNPRFDQNEVVRTHQCGGWGPEEKHGGLPFHRGAPYEVKIVVRNHAYQVYVNNAFFCDFNHRMSKEAVRHLYIEGGTSINRISFVDSIINPAVPFTHHIHGGLQPGKMIILNGVPTGGQRFNVNLLCGHSFDHSDIALHFDARFNYGASHNTVVRTHKAGGGWGNEETHQNYFPFAPNAPFEMVILVEHDKYKIAVNNQHFIEFHHRIHPLHRVTHINVQGDVRLTQVRL